jgi:hypothetical protein
MRRSLLVLAVTAIISLVATISASAASYFQIRINPSTGNWTDSVAPVFVDLPWSWRSVMVGGTAFLQLPNSRLGLRLNIDTGSMTDLSPADPEWIGSYTNGSWRYYDIALGYHFMLGRGAGVVFAGYGNHWAEWGDASGPITRQQASGLIYGVDLFYPLTERWYISGSVAYGGNLSYQYLNAPFTSTRGEGGATSSVYTAALGFRLPNQMASFEVGWRSGGFHVTSIATGDTTIDGTDVRWSGWFLGMKVVK